MIGKILFTLIIIGGFILYLRMKATDETSPRSQQKTERSEGHKMFRQGAYLFLIFMLISALVVFYFEIGDRFSSAKVHVINTQTGQRVTYQANQQDIKSSHFKTLDGRTIYVADIERIEIEPE